MEASLESPRPDFIAIAGRLRRLREVLAPDMSQGEWANMHGFERTQVNNWETGARRISIDAAEKLCGRYGLTLDWIYRGRAEGLPDNLRKSL